MLCRVRLHRGASDAPPAPHHGSPRDAICRPQTPRRGPALHPPRGHPWRATRKPAKRRGWPTHPSQPAGAQSRHPHAYTERNAP